MRFVRTLTVLGALALTACGEKPDERIAALPGLSPEQVVLGKRQ